MTRFLTKHKAETNKTQCYHLNMTPYLDSPDAAVAAAKARVADEELELKEEMDKT